MDIQKSYNSNESLQIVNLTFKEIEQEIQRCPSIIIPLGGTEPLGESISLGCASICAERLSLSLSACLKVLTAPLFAYSCSTAYRAFGGTAGLKQHTFVNAIIDICRDWQSQGFKSILLIDLIADNLEPLADALSRLNGNSLFRVKAFSLHSNKRVKDYVSKITSGVEFGRAEFAVRFLTAYFKNEQEELLSSKQIPLPNADQFETWRKRGKDPQKFRKLFPSASTSSLTSQNLSGCGKEIFNFIMNLLVETYSSFLIPNTRA